MKRQFGLDLLKILAIVMVILLHVLGAGGVLEASKASQSHLFVHEMFRILHTMCLCAVNCFVIVTGAVMYDKAFKPKRIINYWVCVVFYSLCMTAIAASFVPRVSITATEWINACLPVGKEQYWFFTHYVALFFAMPLLNHIVATLERTKLLRVLIGGFCLLSVYPTLMASDIFLLDGGYCFLWFMYLYLCGAYLGKYPETLNWTCKRAMGGFFACVVGTFVYYKVAHLYGQWLGIGDALCTELSEYTSPMILFEAIALYLCFRQLKLESPWIQKVITFLSPSVFYVYILHENIIFKRMIQWWGLFAEIGTHPMFQALAEVLLCAITIFITCIAIDKTRTLILSTFFKRS